MANPWDDCEHRGWGDARRRTRGHGQGQRPAAQRRAHRRARRDHHRCRPAGDRRGLALARAITAKRPWLFAKLPERADSGRLGSRASMSPGTGFFTWAAATVCWGSCPSDGTVNIHWAIMRCRRTSSTMFSSTSSRTFATTTMVPASGSPSSVPCQTRSLAARDSASSVPTLAPRIQT
jgi:hypothetical protein